VIFHHNLTDNGWCICQPGSLLAQMGLLDLAFDIQVKEVYLGKQFFFKRERLAYDTMLCAVEKKTFYLI